MWRKKGKERKAGKTRKSKTTKRPQIKEFVVKKRDNTDKKRKCSCIYVCKFIIYNN